MVPAGRRSGWDGETDMRSTRDSFRVQHESAGNSIGTLTILGAIAQRTVARSGRPRAAPSSGLSEGLRPMTRGPRRQTPPNFLDPVKTAWRQVPWAEIWGIPSRRPQPWYWFLNFRNSW
jgi:hypothetical protein